MNYKYHKVIFDKSCKDYQVYLHCKDSESGIYYCVHKSFDTKTQALRYVRSQFIKTRFLAQYSFTNDIFVEACITKYKGNTLQQKSYHMYYKEEK